MHSEFLRSSLGAGLLLTALVSCAAPEDTGTIAQRVVGGTPTDDARGGVVYVMTEVGMRGNATVVKIGSGTLVAPNLIATALHVTTKNPSNVPFTCDATGNEVSGSQGSLLGAPVAPENVAIYLGPTPDAPVAHGLQIVSSGSSTICKNDLAFVVLDQPLSMPVVPIRREHAAELGDDITVVGYGSESPEPTLDVTRTERDVTVTATGQWIRTFTVSEGPCEGDSGGPALSPDGELVGVFSTVGVECRGSNAAAKYTDLSFFTPLIEDAFLAAGAGSPWPDTASGGGASASGGEASTSNGGETSAAGQRAGGGVTPRGDDSSCSYRPAGTAGGLPLLAAFCAGLSALRVGKRRRGTPSTAQLAQKSARVV